MILLQSQNYGITETSLYSFNDGSGSTFIILKEEQSFDIRFSDHMMGILPIAGIVFLLFCNITIDKQK